MPIWVCKFYVKIGPFIIINNALRVCVQENEMQLDEFWRCINAVRCIKIQHAARCIHNMQGGENFSQCICNDIIHDDITDRNKWDTLTHLAESSSCLKINQNYQVNWPNHCRSMTQIFVKSAEMKITIHPSACYSIYCIIEKCRFESPLRQCVFMEICLIFYEYCIVMRGYIYIYTHTVLDMYVLYVLV